MDFSSIIQSNTEIAIVALGFLMVVGAVAAVYMKSVASAVVSAGLVSLLASIMYLLLSAPDVAMTEAAIGSGLTTVVFFYALSKVKKEEAKQDD